VTWQDRCLEEKKNARCSLTKPTPNVNASTVTTVRIMWPARQAAEHNYAVATSRRLITHHAGARTEARSCREMADIYNGYGPGA
jgi:hypothetical protein